MPSNKPKVLSYLENDEIAALDEFCKENEYSRSQGVSHLVRNYLIENDESSETKVVANGYEEKINSLENKTNSMANSLFCSFESNEKLRGQIAELQEDVFRLKAQMAKNEEEYFTDDEIAAVTHQPEWKVKLWRHGAQKPRGKNIKKNLSPYIVEDGLWKKKASV